MTKTLEQLREEEAAKYPELKVSLWHIRDTMSLTYTDVDKHALTVFLTPDLRMKEVKYKEYRYAEGGGVLYQEAGNMPSWTKDVYDAYQMSSIRETSYSGFKVSLENVTPEYER